MYESGDVGGSESRGGSALVSDVFFFFSSRRRHTRCSRDWSSDVCSSDLGSVQVGIAVDPQKIQVVVVAASGGQQADGLRAIAAEDQHQGAAFHRQFRAQLQVVEAGDDLGEIAGPAMLFVVGKKARRTIAVIDDLVTRGLEPINNRSEEHTSELQSRLHLVCRLLLEQKTMPAQPPF